jgi:hypothetical protein
MREIKQSHDSNLIKSFAIDERWMPMGNMGVTSPTEEYPFPLHIYGCTVDPDCPVWKLVQ